MLDDLDMKNIDSIVRDFEEGKKDTLAQLEITLQPWSVLPWKFAGMTRYVYDTALRVAEDIKAFWE